MTLKLCCSKNHGEKIAKDFLRRRDPFVPHKGLEQAAAYLVIEAGFVQKGKPDKSVVAQLLNELERMDRNGEIVQRQRGGRYGWCKATRQELRAAVSNGKPDPKSEPKRRGQPKRRSHRVSKFGSKAEPYTT